MSAVAIVDKSAKSTELARTIPTSIVHVQPITGDLQPDVMFEELPESMQLSEVDMGVLRTKFDDMPNYGYVAAYRTPGRGLAYVWRSSLEAAASTLRTAREGGASRFEMFGYFSLRNGAVKGWQPMSFVL